MPVVGSVAAVIARQRRDLPRFLHGEAQEAGDRVVDAVERLTPIGRVVDPITGADKGESGHLKRSWRRMRVQATGVGYESGAQNDADYAGYVNNGTRAHIIHGKKNLRFWSQGQLMTLRNVKHPGTEGVFMAERGLAEADVTWQAEGEARLQAFINRTDV